MTDVTSDDIRTIEILQKRLQEKETELGELYKLLERLNSYVNNLIQDTEKGIGVAMGLHRRLATKRVPKISNMSFASRYIMARSELNSYFDFFALPKGEGAGIVLCETKGYGASSVLMSMVMALVETPYVRSPQAFVKTLLDDMKNHGPYAGRPAIFYAIVEKNGLNMKYCSVGMPGVFLAPSGTQTDVLQLETNCKDYEVLEEKRYRLKPGDRIVAVNNGVINTRNSSGEEFGTAGVTRGLANAEHLPIADIISNVGFEIDTFIDGERSRLYGDLAIIGAELERNMLYVV